MHDDHPELAALLAAEPVPTRRPTVPALEDSLFKAHSVLDHGFVRVIDYMGDDAAVVQAARVSYGAGTKSVSSDRGLIRYLMRHRHTTPLEMCELKLHIKLPIFVARQWIRHRTANVNEYSGRYSILDKEFYVPAAEQVAVQSASNRQGRGEALSTQQAAAVLELLKGEGARAYQVYEQLLNDDGQGNAVDADSPQLARELARINLSLGYYTQWYWKIDLHNLLHFLSLRMDPHAQYEIRVYADIIAELVKSWVPACYEAFEDYRLGAHSFSREEMQILTALVAGGSADELLPASGLSMREKRAFRQVLKLGPPKRG